MNCVLKVCSLHATCEARQSFKAIRDAFVFTIQMWTHLAHLKMSLKWSSPCGFWEKPHLYLGPVDTPFYTTLTPVNIWLLSSVWKIKIGIHPHVEWLCSSHWNDATWHLGGQTNLRPFFQNIACVELINVGALMLFELSLFEQRQNVVQLAMTLNERLKWKIFKKSSPTDMLVGWYYLWICCRYRPKWKLFGFKEQIAEKDAQGDL